MRVPMFAEVEKRLVLDATVAKKLVLVAEVEVLLPLIKRLPVMRKFESIVEDAVARKPFKKPMVVEVETP